MKTRGVHLQYSFQADGQRGADIQNPLFDLLSALRQHGSIQHAATAMGASYRHTWGALKQWETTIGEPLVTWTKGQPARLTPFAERLLWAEARARTRMTPHIEALRAELERVLAEALEGSHQVLTIYASHDLALPALREVASEHHRLHIDLRFVGSMDALRALAEGRCTVAGFHVPPLDNAHNLFAQALKPLLRPGRHKLIGCTRRTQGLMVARGNPLDLRGLPDLTRPGVRFVNRQAGSGTRLLTDHLLARQDLPPSTALQTGEAVEDSHLAAAAAIASGLCDAGVGIAAAAEQFGLDLVPLVEEDYFLVCLKDTLEQPAVRHLCEALAGARWRAEIDALPGYALHASGEVLSLTRALPWWQFRVPKDPRVVHQPAGKG
ncbi:MAG: helix-turn-helix transcriptional regulator [Burkholderiales bacterium]|nr:helix-turn-helix transcriptional regulator [Burkholderiales bacterium]